MSYCNDYIEMSYVMVKKYVRLFRYSRVCNFVRVMLAEGWVIVILVNRKHGVRGCFRW